MASVFRYKSTIFGFGIIFPFYEKHLIGIHGKVERLNIDMMRKSGPIIVIEDDLEDQQILDEIFKNLNYPNKILFFADGNDAIEFLNSTEEQPFIILSDINMPKIDGFEVRNKINAHEKINLRSIPYLFFTTGVDKKAVHDAYAMSVQGFFLKPGTMDEYRVL